MGVHMCIGPNMEGWSLPSSGECAFDDGNMRETFSIFTDCMQQNNDTDSATVNLSLFLNKNLQQAFAGWQMNYQHGSMSAFPRIRIVLLFARQPEAVYVFIQKYDFSYIRRTTQNKCCRAEDQTPADCSWRWRELAKCHHSKEWEGLLFKEQDIRDTAARSISMPCIPVGGRKDDRLDVEQLL